MSVYNYAYTAAVPEDSKITPEQVFEALRAKARAPMRFTPVFVSSEVLQETAAIIKRNIISETGITMVEGVDSSKPSSDVQTPTPGSDFLLCYTSAQHVYLQLRLHRRIPEDSKITREQVFEALRAKARAPVKFIPAFASCEVFEETPTFIKRKVITKSGKTMLEDIDLYAPSWVTFKADNGQSVTNLISETSTGALLLTFTFSVPNLSGEIPGEKDESESVKQGKFREIAKEAVHNSMRVILEMVVEGKLN
ncbi:hypothetical protein FRC06_010294 [Ceratobasidium sp. 370]|nr:hypothetical protein FRC06_010294 [Ceratobasidium sp. 370]